jgi:hypothetical protein
MPPGLSASPDSEAAFFAGFFNPTWTFGSKRYTNTELAVQAPYTPSRMTYIYTTWQANDPLVHYLTSDLNEVNTAAGLHRSDDPVNDPVPEMHSRLSLVGARYQPWGRNEQLNGTIGVLHGADAKYNLAFKDPLVWGSDNWDFPTNKYPSAGWLGRVHRGTPWQSVYLKATNILDLIETDNNGDIIRAGNNTWTTWLGDDDAFDARNSRPVQDRFLFDVFTAAPNDSASRGTLSVNQKHLAAWSAVLAGMVALTNVTVGDLGANPYVNSIPTNGFVIIDPAGVDLPSSAVWQIVNGPGGIYETRTNTVIFPLQEFTHVGDILRVPALTEQSPFINRTDAVNPGDRLTYDISDELYEWLPEKLLGLLRLNAAPRYVIYSYGQTLKPAPDGTVLGGGQFFGLVTNYQVVAESATRAVVTVLPVVTNSVINGATVPVTNHILRVESFNVLPPE